MEWLHRTSDTAQEWEEWKIHEAILHIIAEIATLHTTQLFGKNQKNVYHRLVRRSGPLWFHLLIGEYKAFEAEI
jgi:hypothetical protein